MTQCNKYSLPDIERFGGDTTPWEMIIIHDNGNFCSPYEMSGYSYTLTITPYTTISGSGDNAIVVSPVLTVMGELNSDITDKACVVFRFGVDDTIALRGKYIYQIDITKGDINKVSQGILLIKRNINR